MAGLLSYTPTKSNENNNLVKKQVIIKDGVFKCTTTVPYPTEVIKQMKKAGYKIKELI